MQLNEPDEKLASTRDLRLGALAKGRLATHFAVRVAGAAPTVLGAALPVSADVSGVSTTGVIGADYA